MKIKENIAVSENGFLFDSATGESFSVNSIGANILQWLKKLQSIELVQHKIMEIYDVDDITAEKDLLDFISVLKQHELITHENN